MGLKYKKVMTKCNHSFENTESSTLVRMPKRTMVHPAKQDYFCSICKQVFSFIDEDNKDDSDS